MSETVISPMRIFAGIPTMKTFICGTEDLEALTGYAYEQGLIEHKVGLEELFARSTFEISKI